MSTSCRLATADDLDACLRVHLNWLNAFCAAHPAEEWWCPAGALVPDVDDGGRLRQYLWREGGRWAAVGTSSREIVSYVLCRVDPGRRQMMIEHQGPRAAPTARADLGRLVGFVVGRAKQQGLASASVSVHGPQDQIGPLVNLYRESGFEGLPRLEMLGHPGNFDTGSSTLTFRSAEDVGVEAFHEMDAMVRGCSAEESRDNLSLSFRMWTVNPRTDWQAAYERGRVVGVVELAVTREGVGVIDHIEVLEAYRGRGFGKQILAHAMSSFIGRTQVVWLDADQDNSPALRLYQWARFRVHHLHGGLTRQIEGI